MVWLLFQAAWEVHGIPRRYTAIRPPPICFCGKWPQRLVCCFNLMRAEHIHIKVLFIFADSAVVLKDSNYCSQLGTFKNLMLSFNASMKSTLRWALKFLKDSRNGFMVLLVLIIYVPLREHHPMCTPKISWSRLLLVDWHIFLIVLASFISLEGSKI